MAADRQPAVRAMILARSADDRREALERLLPMQRTDFEQIFTVMGRRPVTVRLLDPPLHEFLPDAGELAVELERARTVRPDDVGRLERTLRRVRELEETNPMLGTRGSRLGIVAPEIYDIQVEAIIAAARAVPTRPVIEVMLPLIAYERELQILRDRVEAVVERLGAHELELTIGTMIELPRACFVADRLARRADFFSFGTNDLTQTAIGLSRDDVESGFLGEYLEQRIIDRSPFETIDAPGVGWLVRLGAWVGREANPDLKLGVCGEHGGDPDSIAFFDMAGLDYVSCSPFRLPVARVAAAQAAIAGPARTGGRPDAARALVVRGDRPLSSAGSLVALLDPRDSERDRVRASVLLDLAPAYAMPVQRVTLSSQAALLLLVQTMRATGSEPGTRIVYVSGSAAGRPVRESGPRRRRRGRARARPRSLGTRRA